MENLYEFFKNMIISSESEIINTINENNSTYIGDPSLYKYNIILKSILSNKINEIYKNYIVYFKDPESSTPRLIEFLNTHLYCMNSDNITIISISFKQNTYKYLNFLANPEICITYSNGTFNFIPINSKPYFFKSLFLIKKDTNSDNLKKLLENIY